MNATFIPALLWLMAVGLPLTLAAGFASPRCHRVLGALVPWVPLPAVLAALWPGPGQEMHFVSDLLGARLGLDELGRVFLLVSALLWLLSGVFARGYMPADHSLPRFQVCWLLAMAGNFTLIFAQDIHGFYTGFALMSFASYGLVIHSDKPDALYAGRVYLSLVVVGELLLFTGFVMLAHAAGGFSFQELDQSAPGGLAIAFILVGFGIKAGALPLHVWLPLAHPAAPVPASAVLSGAMIKAGLLGWLRFVPAGAPGMEVFSTPLLIAGLAAALLAAMVGVLQSNPKTVLAYSSISQMGLTTIGFGAALLRPEIAPAMFAAVALYALHHGLAKGALFLGVGLAGASATAAQHRRSWAILLLPALALAGAPLTSGAMAKTALKAGLGELPAPWPAWLDWLLPLAAIGTTALMVRVLFLLWPAPSKPHPHPRVGGMWLSLGTLVVIVGSVAWLAPTGRHFVLESLSPGKLWALSWPIMAGVLVAGWVIQQSARKRISSARQPAIPAGDLLIPFAWGCQALRRLWPAGVFRRLAAGIANLRTSIGRSLAADGPHRAKPSPTTPPLPWPRLGLILALLSAALLLALQS